MNEDFYEEDGDWMDGDALASAGWGTDEDYGGYEDAGFEEAFFGDA